MFCSLSTAFDLVDPSILRTLYRIEKFRLQQSSNGWKLRRQTEEFFELLLDAHFILPTPIGEGENVHQMIEEVNKRGKYQHFVDNQSAAEYMSIRRGLFYLTIMQLE